MIDVESQKVMTTISMDTKSYGSGDMSATIIWACLSFFLAKVNSQGFDSITISPNF
jgi:Na+/melibiose symporter-like transporter